MLKGDFSRQYGFGFPFASVYARILPGTQAKIDERSKATLKKKSDVTNTRDAAVSHNTATENKNEAGCVTV